MIHSTINFQNYQSDAKGKKVLSDENLEHIKARELVDVEGDLKRLKI